MLQCLKFKTENPTPPIPLFNKEGVPFDAVRPELVEGWNGSQDWPKAGALKVEGPVLSKVEGVRGGVKRFTHSPIHRFTSIFCILSSVFCLLSLSALPAYAGTVDLPKTGQTTSYATGDDGDLEKGVAWPSPRFTDNGDGTVTDNLTGLVWLKDANCFGTQSWADALTAANTLASGSCGLSDGSTAGQWRLPNVNELESLVHAGQSNSATWLNTQGFSNTPPNGSWSSTTVASSTDYAWIVLVGNGRITSTTKTNNWPVWPVRAGQAAPAELPKTGQTPSYATGDDGDLEKGVTWPNPRFMAGTGAEAECVTDNLTGLMWVKAPGYTARTWADALTYANGLSLCGYNDWRLPNHKELRSLNDYGQSSNANWLLNQGFSDFMISAHWSATTDAYYTNAWVFFIGNGGTSSDYDKTGSYYVWPVRAGQSLDISAPTTTASPAGGTYSSAQSVTLTCNDGTGSGCDKIYYTTDGSEPTTSSAVYSTPISISASTTLKFFAKDLAGNSESVKTETYTIITDIPTSSLRLWLKADAGITKDGSGYVSAWADQSGNGFNVAQGTAAKQPLFVDSSTNGKPVIMREKGREKRKRGQATFLEDKTGKR